jgi:hypothetical protein
VRTQVRTVFFFQPRPKAVNKYFWTRPALLAESENSAKEGSFAPWNQQSTKLNSATNYGNTQERFRNG